MRKVNDIQNNNEQCVAHIAKKYMTEEQTEYFRNKLLKMREELLSESSNTLNTSLHKNNINYTNTSEVALQENDASIEVALQDIKHHTLLDIDYALFQIEEGTYGYCEETGNQIGIKRLEIMPTARLCVKAQEKCDILEQQNNFKEDM